MKINVRVTTRARENKITKDGADSLRVYTTIVPADGKANDAVIKMLASHFDVPKTSIKLVRGATCRDKVFEL